MPVPWSAVASDIDVQLGAETAWQAISELGTARLNRRWDEPPQQGSLTPELCRALVDKLSNHTATEMTCWFALWDGYGFLDVPQSAGPDRVHLSQRSYLLFQGPLVSATKFFFGPFYQSPNIWWPDDRAWCVASEVDLESTYVACSSELCRELLNEFESFAASPDLRVDSVP